MKFEHKVLYRLLISDKEYQKEILITDVLLNYAKYPEKIIGKLVLDTIKEFNNHQHAQQRTFTPICKPQNPGQ